MFNVFKSLELQNVLVRNIDVYGCIVKFNRKLSQEFVRKSLANCFIYITKPLAFLIVDNRCVCTAKSVYWLGYLEHRDDGPAIISNKDDQFWYQYGKLHRDNDQPAIIYQVLQAWYQHGKLHRDNDQPALVYSTGFQEFWFNGKQYFP